MAKYQWRNPTPPWVGVYTFNDYRDESLEKHKDLYGEDISSLVSGFQNFGSIGESLTHDEFRTLNYPNNRRVGLSQSDFHHGTVRLIHSAEYYLTENIVFEPNIDDNWMPTPEQTEGGAHAEYPIAPYGPYSLGFFAAITMEGAGILLNLNGFMLQSYSVFDIQQRFFACIETASSPFVPPQGPGNFGSNFTSATDSYICNGYLGLSSHHGIHGNSNSRLLIQNLIIQDFEVAGIHLSGPRDTLIRNVSICNMSKTVKVLSTYSTARFIGPFLDKAITFSQDASIVVGGRTVTGSEIKKALEDESKTVLEDVRAGRSVSSELFGNKTGLYDGNGYGLVLAARGIIIGPFPSERSVKAEGNENVVVHDVRIEGLQTGEGEILGVCACDPKSLPAYGGATQVGPVGETIQVKVIRDDQGKYTGNVVSDAEIYISKFGKDGEKGKANITPIIVDWAEGGKVLDEVMAANNMYYVSGGDSMAHTMKGLIQIYISTGRNLRLWDIHAEGAHNKAPIGIVDVPGPPLTKSLFPVFNGAATRGLAIASCESIFVKDSEFRDISSDGGSACAIELIGKCANIRCRTNIKKGKIKSAQSGHPVTAPNTQNTADFTRVSSESKIGIELA